MTTNQSRVEALQALVQQAFDLGHESSIVETGRYKGWQVCTVQALGRRGYRVERAAGCATGMWRVYRKATA